MDFLGDASTLIALPNGSPVWVIESTNKAT